MTIYSNILKEKWKDVFCLYCTCVFLYSLYPHLYTRAYINFKNPEDIVLFRDRFDGYVFIDNKGNSELKAFTLLLSLEQIMCKK